LPTLHQFCGIVQADCFSALPFHSPSRARTRSRRFPLSRTISVGTSKQTVHSRMEQTHQQGKNYSANIFILDHSDPSSGRIFDDDSI
jgi:hypothetical protein